MAQSSNMIATMREVWLYAPPQPSFTAAITDVEEAVFWINLPREGGQILMLQENQNIKIRVYLPDGFYSAETTVAAIGDNNEKFYALAIPDEFVRTQDRRFVRARFAVNITFTDSGLTAHTSAVNFSTGGVMVYLVPELKKILENTKKLFVYFEVDEVPFQFPARLAWQKVLNNIPYAGFEFLDVPPGIQDTLIRMAIKYSRNK